MAKVVDLRSDTVTKPTIAMRLAMAEAVVGDDVYNEDPTVNKLQEKVAELLGKEAALFVPTGTMGNLSAIMAHCYSRGQEVLLGDQTHIFLYEQGGVSQLGGVSMSTLRNLDDGTFDLDELERKFRPPVPNIHEPKTGLICLENSHNRCGGRVLPLSFIQKVCDIARKRDIPVHMDGARIINAAVYYGISVKEIVKDCASVSMCFSKGIGAPIGSAVAGSKEFIDKVYRCRKVLGGAMRQVGVLAAAALVGLETAEQRLQVDHYNAKELANDIYQLKSPLLTVSPELVDSNMLLLNFPSNNLTSEEFVDKMQKVNPEDTEDVVVKGGALCGNRVRWVLHSDITKEDLSRVVIKLKKMFAN